MSARVLRGTKEEIAAALARMNEDVREAIVFVEEAAPPPADIFAEMEPHLVAVEAVDDSRQAIYSPMDGE